MANIGVLAHEQQQAQPIVIDLEFSIDSRKAAASDDVADTIDYSQVKSLIHDVVKQRHYQLLESLAHAIVTALVAAFSLQDLRLSLSKPDIFPDMEAVGIVVEHCCY